MKKQIKKLSLNKKTISNLHSSEMSLVIGGVLGKHTHYQSWCHCGSLWCGGATRNGNTCPGHNTCNTCAAC